MEIINNKEAWKWYILGINVLHKFNYEHLSEPEQYPCKVKSTTGPYVCLHEFIYQKKVKCVACGHETFQWNVDE